MVSEQGRRYYENLLKGQPFGSNGFDFDGLRSCMASRREPTIPGVRCIRTTVEKTPAEWVLAPNADPAVRLLYLHGGGFVSGAGAFYLTMAAHISAAAGCAVLLPDYRLAPEHPFPAGLEDCVRAHEWIRAHAPDGQQTPAKATFIAGDSAGGGLTLSVLLALRDRHRPLPAGAIALSPFADLTLTGESLRSEAGKDPIMHPKCLPDFTSRYLGATDPRHPLASPAFGNYAKIPPLLIQVGEHEIIRSDSELTAAKAKADGCQVTLEIWEGMFHVFTSHEPLLPEAVQAIGHMAAFMKALRPPILEG